MKIFVYIVVVIAILTFFFVHPYTSSPGLVTSWDTQEFEKAMPKCKGFSVLLNPGVIGADASGISLCIGLLEKSDYKIQRLPSL